MEYANKGNLRKCLAEIASNWGQKLYMLYKIIEGLNNIHKENLIHYGFHDGNILCIKYNDTLYGVYISDYLGSYQSAKSFLKKDNIYGVVPFIAPEILKGEVYTQASDIYSFSMIMWEFTSGIPPFSDKAHDLQLALSICKGERPEIIDNIPQCYTNLMKKCWDEDPLKRPFASEVLDIIEKWIKFPHEKKIEDISKELKSNIMGLINAPIGYSNFNAEYHPQAYYTSRLLDFTSEEKNKLGLVALQQKNSQFEQDIQKLRLQIKEFAEKENTLQAQITFFQNEKQTLTNNLTEQLEQNKLYNQQVQDQINQLNQELVDLQQKNSQFEHNNQNLKLDLAVQIKKSAGEEVTLRTQIIDLQKEIYEKQLLSSNLAEQLEQNKLTNQRIQDQINQLKREKINLQEKLTKIETNIQELKSQQESLIEQKESLIEQKESLIEQKEQFEIKLGQSQDNCERIEQEKTELRNILGGLSADQKFNAKLKAKLKREINKLEQELKYEKQIKEQLVQALQIKEDKINELEKKLINLDNERINTLKNKRNELKKIKKELINKLSSGEDTKEAHKEREAKEKELDELEKELSRTDANRKKRFHNEVNKFMESKSDFLTSREEAINKLQNCYNHLKSYATDKEDKYIKEFQNTLVKYNDGFLKLNKGYDSLTNIVRENKELEVTLKINNILKLDSFNIDRYNIFNFAINSRKGTRTKLNSSMMEKDINSLKKNLDELKAELKQEREELKNLE
ncbi:kinase-like domain-containing protein [Rhizophagus clarus]|uniref:Kinase-like domain-containing protein n=2 Tax=Rhizophagus clarus TaxID=94130 RepID=A0A8H3QFM6_9GLOM|nr:kinase-like domain-containing protein [Rhizophagus clarus]